MAWAALYTDSGTVGTTERSVPLGSTSGVPASKTDKATIMPVIDVSNLVVGDVFQATLYDKCRAGDTQYVVEAWMLIGGATKKLVYLPSFMAGEGWDFTLKKISGTDRVIATELRAYS